VGKKRSVSRVNLLQPGINGHHDQVWTMVRIPASSALHTHGHASEKAASSSLSHSNHFLLALESATSTHQNHWRADESTLQTLPYHQSSPSSDMISASVQVDALSLVTAGEIAYRCMLVFLQVVNRNHYKAVDRATTSYCRYNLPFTHP
jgi:hypothetical protein